MLERPAKDPVIHTHMKEFIQSIREELVEMK